MPTSCVAAARVAATFSAHVASFSGFSFAHYFFPPHNACKVDQHCPFAYHPKYEPSNYGLTRDCAKSDWAKSNCAKSDWAKSNCAKPLCRGVSLSRSHG